MVAVEGAAVCKDNEDNSGKMTTTERSSEATAAAEAEAATTTSSPFRMSLGKKKKSKKPVATGSNKQHQETKVQIQEAFGEHNARKNDKELLAQLRAHQEGPLVIPLPAVTDKSKRNGSLLQKLREEKSPPTNAASVVKQEDVTADQTKTAPRAQNGEKTEDTEAYAALMLQADAVTSSGVGGGGGGAAGAKSVIAPSADRFERRDNDHSSHDHQLELNSLPDAVSPEDVETYSKVPIGEFGAAMLRGMGWSGGGEEDGKSKRNSKSKNKDDEPVMPRPHRLGLGAIPAGSADNLQTPSNDRSRRPLRPDQLQRQERMRQQAAEFARQQSKQKMLDKQKTLQINSLVLLRQNNNGDHRHHEPQQRARIVQLTGVPGLNMIKVQLERRLNIEIIKKGQVERLLSREELEKAPFREPTPPSSKGKSNDSSHIDGQQQQRRQKHKEQFRNGNDDGSDDVGGSSSHFKRKRRRPGEDDNGAYRQKYKSTKDHRRGSGDDYEDDHPRHNGHSNRRREVEKEERDRKVPRLSRQAEDRDRNRRARDDPVNDGARKHYQLEQPTAKSKTWLVPNIRVRIITQKLGKRYYKEKAVVVDVTCTAKGKPAATLVLAGNGRNGGINNNQQVLDQVPERYLETALPKVGGNAVVLNRQRQHQYLATGQLLERSSKTCQGVIQLHQDKTVLTLSLDDLAEWCGPIEEGV